LDAEVIGAAEPAADVELLCFADQLLRELGINDGVTLKLNTLGDATSRDAWRAALVAHFEGYRGDLSEDSQRRLEANPMRILDSKDPRDRPAADSAPKMVLSGEAEEFFGKVREGLDAAGVAYEIAPHLVRGLDYYRHTAFEFVTDRLGAQGTVLGGGRYDGLIETLGGPHTPAVGWAAGIERLGMLIEAPDVSFGSVEVIPEDNDAHLLAIRITQILRDAGIAANLAYRGREPDRYSRAVKAERGVIKVGTPFPGDDGDGRLKYQRGGCSIEHFIEQRPVWDCALASRTIFLARPDETRDFGFVWKA
jgi:histidyl-tRNA synthetase